MYIISLIHKLIYTLLYRILGNSINAPSATGSWHPRKAAAFGYTASAAPRGFCQWISSNIRNGQGDDFICKASLVGGIPTPLKNIGLIGMTIPNIFKIKNVSNHQPDLYASINGDISESDGVK